MHGNSYIKNELGIRMPLVVGVGILMPTLVQRKCVFSTIGSTIDLPDLQTASSYCAKTNDGLQAGALGDEIELTEVTYLLIGSLIYVLLYSYIRLFIYYINHLFHVRNYLFTLFMHFNKSSISPD